MRYVIATSKPELIPAQALARELNRVLAYREADRIEAGQESSHTTEAEAQAALSAALTSDVITKWGLSVQAEG